MSSVDPFRSRFEVFGRDSGHVVEEVNREAFERLRQLLEAEESGDGRVVLLRAPRAGFGKTALLQRLAEAFDDSHQFVRVCLVGGRTTDASHVLEYVLQAMCNVVEDSITLTHLDLLARKVFALGLEPLVSSGEVPCQDQEGALGALREQPIETFDFHHDRAVTAHWTKSNFDILGPRLAAELAQLSGASLRESSYWVELLFRFATTAPDNVERSRLLFETVFRGDAQLQSESAAEERLHGFLTLLGLVTRMVFVVDDTEGLSTHPPDALELASFLTNLSQNCPRTLVVLSVNGDVWETAFLPRLPGGLVDRLTEYEVSLSSLTREQAEALIADRAGDRAGEVLARMDWGEDELYARRVLKEASEVWQTLEPRPALSVFEAEEDESIEEPVASEGEKLPEAFVIDSDPFADEGMEEDEEMEEVSAEETGSEIAGLEEVSHEAIDLAVTIEESDDAEEEPPLDEGTPEGDEEERTAVLEDLEEVEPPVAEESAEVPEVEAVEEEVVELESISEPQANPFKALEEDEHPEAEVSSPFGVEEEEAKDDDDAGSMAAATGESPFTAVGGVDSREDDDLPDGEPVSLEPEPVTDDTAPEPDGPVTAEAGEGGGQEHSPFTPIGETSGFASEETLSTAEQSEPVAEESATPYTAFKDPRFEDDPLDEPVAEDPEPEPPLSSSPFTAVGPEEDQGEPSPTDVSSIFAPITPREEDQTAAEKLEPLIEAQEPEAPKENLFTDSAPLSEPSLSEPEESPFTPYGVPPSAFAPLAPEEEGDESPSSEDEREDESQPAAEAPAFGGDSPFQPISSTPEDSPFAPKPFEESLESPGSESVQADVPAADASVSADSSESEREESEFAPLPPAASAFAPISSPAAPEDLSPASHDEPPVSSEEPPADSPFTPIAPEQVENSFSESPPAEKTTGPFTPIAGEPQETAPVSEESAAPALDSRFTPVEEERGFGDVPPPSDGFGAETQAADPMVDSPFKPLEPATPTNLSDSPFEGVGTTPADFSQAEQAEAPQHTELPPAKIPEPVQGSPIANSPFEPAEPPTYTPPPSAGGSDPAGQASPFEAIESSPSPFAPIGDAPAEPASGNLPEPPSPVPEPANTPLTDQDKVDELLRQFKERYGRD